MKYILFIYPFCTVSFWLSMFASEYTFHIFREVHYPRFIFRYTRASKTFGRNRDPLFACILVPIDQSQSTSASHPQTKSIGLYSNDTFLSNAPDFCFLGLYILFVLFWCITHKWCASIFFFLLQKKNLVIPYHNCTRRKFGIC